MIVQFSKALPWSSADDSRIKQIHEPVGINPTHVVRVEYDHMFSSRDKYDCAKLIHSTHTGGEAYSTTVVGQVEWVIRRLNGEAL